MKNHATNINECAVPNFLAGGTNNCMLPECSNAYRSVVEEYKILFSSITGRTEAIFNTIFLQAVLGLFRFLQEEY